MPDLIAIGQGLSALKAATETMKTIMGLRDGAKLLENTVELNQNILAAQSALLDAQQEQTALTETIQKLEEEIASIRTWDAEKQRYELTSLGNPGIFSYSIKEASRGAEPPHSICPDCYEDGKKSVLQQITRFPGQASVMTCGRCGWETYVQGGWHPEHSSGIRRGQA
jgi:hypothetical protein